MWAATMTKRPNPKNNESYESRGVRDDPRMEYRSRSDSIRVRGSQSDQNERTIVGRSQNES